MQPRSVRIALLAVLVTLTVMLALGRDEDGLRLTLPHGDANYHYVYLPSLWLDLDVDLTNQYAVSGDPWRHRITPVGRPGNVFGIGAALFESPSFLIGHALARIAGLRADGFSSIELFLVAWASVLATLGALYFAYRLLARRLGDARIAGAAALLVLAGGPALFYAVRQPGMSHPFALLFAAWLVDAWDASYERERDARTWLKLGALLGLTILARPQLVTWGLCLVAAGVSDLIAARHARALPRVLGRLALGVTATFACVLPQLLVWYANYGSLIVVPQGDGFMRWDTPAWSETLFSSRNGLLPWAPLYALALAGLVAGIRRAPRVVTALLAGIALQSMINGAAWDWWAGGAFGGRRFDSTYIAFAFGLGMLLVACRRLHRIALIACLVAATWLAVANIVLTLNTTPHSMRMKGGEAASDVIASELGVLGAPVSGMSSLANLPARLLFALGHDTELAAYDRVAGVHWLAELYPGLSTRTVKTVDRRVVAALPAVFKPGIYVDTITGERGRVLVGLNRRGPVRARIGAIGTGTISVRWNDDAVATAALGPGVQVIEFHTGDFERGVNELTLIAPAGTRIPWIELGGEADP